MTISRSPRSTRRVLAGLALGGSLMALAACSNDPITLDWDLRNGPGSTAEEARQATASKPVPDANGILSYPGYQLAQARRGETVAAMAGRLGLNPEDLARTNALRPADPLREGEMLLLPNRVSAAPQPVAGSPAAAAPGSRPVDITSIATTALDSVPATAPAAKVPGGGKEPIRHTVARGETAFTIARAYNVSAKALADWNGLGADMSIREGQTLIIPVATAAAPNPEPAAHRRPAPAARRRRRPRPRSRCPTRRPSPPRRRPKDTPALARPGQGAHQGDAAGDAGCRASIIRAYDKKKNQGVDIAAAAGIAGEGGRSRHRRGGHQGHRAGAPSW
jgi:LysM repeat protein